MNPDESTLHCPCSRDDFGSRRADRRVEAGRRRNAETDAIDAQLGCVPVGLCPTTVHLEFALDALHIGLAFDDWGRVEEGAAMLQDVIGRLADDAGRPRNSGRDDAPICPETEVLDP